jgi:hypothetical protein
MNPHDRNATDLAELRLLHATSEAGNNGSPLEECGPEGDADVVGYDPVPPKKTVTLSVRYLIRRRGQPLPYPLDEGVGE